MRPRIATPDAWKNLPMPDRHVTLALDFTLNAAESALVLNGFIPLQMEDKWFLYFEGETLYFHRSWTGFCIAQVHFVPHDGGLRAISAEVNRDPEQYQGTDDGADAQLIERLVRGLDAWVSYQNEELREEP